MLSLPDRLSLWIESIEALPDTGALVPLIEVLHEAHAALLRHRCVCGKTEDRRGTVGPWHCSPACQNFGRGN